jgi:hypothetical protein
MERGTPQIMERETSGLASANAEIEPAAAELGHPVYAPQSAGAPCPAGNRAREFEWSLATYFGQSFVVGAYRAPDCG